MPSTRPSSINPGSNVVGMPGATGLGAAGEVLPIAPPGWMSNPEIVASGLVFGPGTTFEGALAAARARNPNYKSPEQAARETWEAEDLRRANEAYGRGVNAGSATSQAGWNVQPEGLTPRQAREWTDRASRIQQEGYDRRRAFDIDWRANNPIPPNYTMPAPEPAATPVAPNKPSGASLDVGTPAPAPTDAAKNFLPPYLQPGANAGSPFGKSAAPTLTGAPTGNAVAPPITTPTPAPGSLIAPMKPPGSSGFTSGFTPNAPSTASAGGSFASTAKLLELPYYLRQQYGR